MAKVDYWEFTLEKLDREDEEVTKLGSQMVGEVMEVLVQVV